MAKHMSREEFARRVRDDGAARLSRDVRANRPRYGVIVRVNRMGPVKVSLRIMTMPIQAQGIITRDNVSVDVSAVAYYRVDDPVKSVVAIENVAEAINQIAQTTLRKVVGQHMLDEVLAETDRINASIPQILDPLTKDWGMTVTLVELKDIQLPEAMTVVVPAPLMTTIQELGAFFAREAAAAPTLAGKARELSSDTDGAASKSGHL